MALSPGLKLSLTVSSTILQAWLGGAAGFSPLHSLHIGTARLAFPQAGLTLAAEDGEGTQAGFQFFHELGAVCSQYAAKP